jgi:hypothetical protein
MAASRLSDSQKSELVARYRAGEGSAELAAIYGCSANTVSRTVKAALPPREYEQLKQDRARGLKPSLAPLEIPDAPQQLPLTAFDPAAVPNQADQASPVASAPLVVTDQQISQFSIEVPPASTQQRPDQNPVQDLDKAAELTVEGADDFVMADTDDCVMADTDDFVMADTDDFVVADTVDFVVIDTTMEQPSSAAIDSSDGEESDSEESEDKYSYDNGIYGANDDDDKLDEEDDDGLSDNEEESDGDEFTGDEVEVFLPIGEQDEDGDERDDDELEEDDGDEFAGDEEELFLPVAITEQRLQPVSCQPLKDAPLPASVYMLVDKTVELEARPLKEFPELGLLPPEEEELQALQVFVNPRQAKRHCGRSQRVIKIPDTRIFERTANHLLAQGISRLVIENSLYSLPGA